MTEKRTVVYLAQAYEIVHGALRAGAEMLFHLLSPPRCLICLTMGKPVFCDDCVRLIRPLPSGTCPFCAIGDARSCRCRTWMAALDFVRSAHDYKGVAGLAVRRLKYQFQQELAAPMGAQMKSVLETVPQWDVVVPVPIHWTRYTQRGFNQAQLISRSIGIQPIREDILIRFRPTLPQVQLRGSQRLKNLRRAMKAVHQCDGLRVLLVDDVVTSGGTLEACASALKQAGAKWVGAITYAAEIPDPIRRLIRPELCDELPPAAPSNAQASGSSIP